MRRILGLLVRSGFINIYPELAGLYLPNLISEYATIRSGVHLGLSKAGGARLVLQTDECICKQSRI